MAFLDEIVKLQRTRSVYIDFSKDYNPGIDPWTSTYRRLFGKTFDPRGPLPIHGTVKRFGVLNRSICNADFAFESPSVSPELIDADNEWRILGYPPSNLLLYRWLMFRLRVAGDDGTIFDERIGAGQITRPSFPTNKSVSLACQITPAAFLGATIPRRLIGPAWPEASPDIKAKRVPFYYGKHGTPLPGSVSVIPPDPEPVSLVVCSYLESEPWRTFLAGGTPAAAAPGTPYDYYGPGCFGMGRLANGKIWIATETFFWTVNPDFTNPNPDPTAFDNANCSSTSGLCFGGAPYQFDLFSGGTNGTNLYGISIIPPDYSTPRMLEIDPVTWTMLRQWPIASNCGFPNIGVNAAATFAYYDDSFYLSTTIKKLDLSTGVETTFLTTTGGCGGLIVLSDDTVLIAAWPSVKRYSPAGALLQTYGTIGPYSGQGNLALGIPGRNSFWLMGPGTGGSEAHLYEYKLDTGDLLDDFPLYGDDCGGPFAVVSRPGVVPPPDPDAPVICETTSPTAIGGACPAYLVKSTNTDVHGVYRPDPALAVVTTGYATTIPGGDLTVPTWFLITILREGHEGPAGPLISGSGSSVRISWTPTPGGTARPGDGYRVYCFDNPSFDPFSGTLGGATKVRTIFHEGGILDGEYSPTEMSVDFTSFERYPENRVGLPPSATRDFIPGTTFTFRGPRYVIAGHACKEIRDVFSLRPDPRAIQDAVAYQTIIDAAPDDYTDAQKTAARTLSSDGNKVVQLRMREGTDYLVELVQRNDDCFETIVFDQEQNDVESCQQFEITVNLFGIETNADRTGTLVEKMGDVVDHLFLNWVWNSYRSSIGLHAPAGGKWFTTVPYAPGLWDSASCQIAQAVSNGFIAGGYYGDGGLIEGVDVSQLVQDVLASFGLDLYFDNSVGNGSFFVHLFDPASVVRATLPSLTPDNTFLKGTFSPLYDQDMHANIIPYFAGPRVLVGYIWSGEKRDYPSIGVYGALVAKQPYIVNWTSHIETVLHVMQRRVDLVKYPPILATAGAVIGVIVNPLASTVKVTHPDGIGNSSTGWVNRVCRIYKSDIDLDQITAGLLLRDVDALVP